MSEPGPSAPEGADVTRAALRPLPWRQILAWAFVGMALGTVLVLADLRSSSDTTGGLVHTGPTGPASELIATDFPDQPQFTYGESDGPMFYAVARDFWDFDRAAESLDRPRYRLNRPFYPFLGWLLHPTGGGDGLVRSLFLVNVGAMFLAALAMGALSSTLRGPPWLGVLAPIIPGAQMAVRIECSDLLASALMLAAAVLFIRNRWVAATAVAVAAVLTKEPVLLTFLGLALWRRDRRGLAIAAVPAVVYGLWALSIRLRVPDSGQDIIEFGPPFVGIVDSIRLTWSQGDNTYALMAFVALVVLSVIGLRRSGLAHPLAPALLLNLALISLLSITPIGLSRNGPRSVLPALLLAVVMVATPKALAAVGRGTPRRTRADDPASADASPGGAGTVAPA